MNSCYKRGNIFHTFGAVIIPRKIERVATVERKRRHKGGAVGGEGMRSKEERSGERDGKKEER